MSLKMTNYPFALPILEGFVEFVKNFSQENSYTSVASIIGAGYIAGLWPPGFLLDGNRAKNVLHNLIEAHVQAYDKITSLDNVDADRDGISKMVGFSHAIVAVSPAKPARLFGATFKNNQEA